MAAWASRYSSNYSLSLCYESSRSWSCPPKKELSSSKLLSLLCGCLLMLHNRQMHSSTDVKITLILSYCCTLCIKLVAICSKLIPTQSSSSLTRSTITFNYYNKRNQLFLIFKSRFLLLTTQSDVSSLFKSMSDYFGDHELVISFQSLYSTISFDLVHFVIGT